MNACVFYSYYCNENSGAEQTTQTQRRRQIHMPQSTSSSSVFSSCQRPSPTTSDIVLSSHWQDSDNSVTPTFASILTDGSETEDYEERTRTWPRKRGGHDRHRQGVGHDSSDPARLAGNSEELHNVSARLASQQDSATAFTACYSMDEMQHCNDIDPLFSAATVAAELLGASPSPQTNTRNHIQYSPRLYSVNSYPTTSSFSTPQPSTDPPVLYTYSYSSSSVSQYNDTRGHSSPAVGTGLAAADGRHAVDMLFAHLSGFSGQSQPDAASVPRNFPTSPPQLPAHVPLAPMPFNVSNDHHSSAADLSSTDHASHAVSPATGMRTQHR